MTNRYMNAREYYKNKYGERVLKICIDGGFSCPNRDGTKGFGGCIFCSERGSGEKLSPINISAQIKNYFNSYKATRANKFIVYFQNFSNTYAPVDELRAKYESVLIDDRIVGINIGTRPDCINHEIVKLLKELNAKTDVTIELGLQTVNEEIGKIINRKYTNADFSNAVHLLNNAGINVIAHLMAGLPNETHEDVAKTIEFINRHNLLGLKVHSTYVIDDTVLGQYYKSNQYTPITLEYYTEELAYIINHISPAFVLFRIMADAPKELLLAPMWNCHKKIVLNEITRHFDEHDVHQGKFYKK